MFCKNSPSGDCSGLFSLALFSLATCSAEFVLNIQTNKQLNTYKLLLIFVKLKCFLGTEPHVPILAMQAVGRPWPILWNNHCMFYA